ncbi:filamentous hemagglutinin N-terminal domain-containing protein [Megamonas funiformis]|nr:filamentous hemagglutinin N-terminal domain-containing protein [Megamonas funiformis]
MKIRNKKLLTKSIAMAIFMSSTLYTMPITHAAFNNNTLPSGGSVVAGTNVNISDPANITQESQNAVIQWKDFSIGANATVNFNGPSTGFNTLNYVNGGNLSQIYGTINATNGNIYIVNPAGVQIGNSAQINVGSLYVSNNLNNDKLNIFGQDNINTLKSNQPSVSGGELMSLGNINATNVTFDGNRIVLDVDRVKNGQTPLDADNITIKTTEADLKNKNVVLGYTAYDDRVDDNSKKIGYKYTTDKNNSSTSLAKLILDDNTTKDITKADGFMWVKDGEQLQAMNTNLSGNYAFRNSIDLNSTADKNVTFNSVGDSNNAFTGNLDGLGNEVYGLHIDEKTDNTGLFAKTDGATIRNFNLISGSITSKSENAGAVVGNANNTVIENVKNTINVTGANNVGGIIGTGTKVTLNGVVNAGAIKGNSNVGGLAGSLVGSLTAGSTLKGESYNLGDIKGTVNNIGGLVGSASHSTIGNKTGFQMYNHLDVEGGYNVGGIVGNLEDGSTVQNVSNDGNIKATRYIGDKYSYHTNNAIEANNKVNLNKAGEAKKDVHISNVGGIVGNSTGDTDIADSIKTTNIIKDVLNNGDVSAKLDTTTNSNMPYYTAGNVGGVVGSAVNTDISNATNKENDVRGAHNVGGIVGYFEDGTITKAINNGGDIMATGARNEDGFVTEFVRYDSRAGGNESFIVGNIGGIVGYMYGEDAYINTSANRGTVHTEDIVDEGNILDTSKAANVGGIVGKIDRSTTISMDNIKKPTNGQQNKYAISNSYNTGNVRGYTGVGGVAGMMYNGEIVGSYNIGEIRSTRKDTTSVSPLNMGGIVGDSTEETSAKISLYDVYNKGQIGDEEFVYKGRHVGGIAGRLSGDVEKSYNNGDIYNGATVTGGIAGWWVKGDITNSFNTGNITNYSTTYSANGSNVGGIAGGMGIYQTDLSSKLENVYNLGTIRSIKGASSNTTNTVGGMIGTIGGAKAPGRLTIKNVYTLGNLYSVDNGTATAVTKMIGSYYTGSHNVTISNAYYINTTNNKNINKGTNTEGSKTPQAPTKLISESDSINGKLEDVYEGFNSNDWRIYKGTTPILNAFMPESSGYLKDEKLNNGLWSSLNISSVQYGTAYDPLLTIINAQDSSKNVNLDWQKLGIYGDGGLAVYNSGLTLDNFKNSDKGVGLFGGFIYSDGALNIKSYDGDENTAENIAENIGLGSFSKIYGSSVTIDAGETGTVDAYGSIISTGNNNTKGDITITGANVNTYGEIKTAVADQKTTIDGIKGSISDEYKYNIGSDLTDQNAEMSNIAEGYAHTVTAGKDSTGDVFISATNGGDVNIYYGNMEKGIIDTQGDVSLSGNNVYVDSDMVIGGNLTTTASSAGEIVLDISNIGKVSLKQYTNNLYKALVANGGNLDSIDRIKTIIKNFKIDLNDGQLTAFANYLYTTYVGNGNNTLNSKATESAISDAIIKGRMHNFLKSFSDNKSINFKGTDNAKITVDLWDGSKFNLKKYDQGGNTLSEELSNLNIKDKDDNPLSGREVTYIWVADGEQLKGIQNYANEDKDSNILSYNFALKNDINATDVSDYQAIGSGDTAFTGKFDGRGNRIIGLNVDNTNNHTATDNVGVFGVNAGTIKNLKVYSSTFKGYDNVGAIAGTNNGTIDNVTTLGNTVEAVGSGFSNNTLDSTKYVGAAGGVVGTNTGTVDNATSRDSVIAGQNSGGALTTAGGIAGINTGLVSNSQSHSAVIASGSKGNTYSLGGIVGVNTASDKDQDGNIIKGLDNVNAYGVTGSSILVDNTGGIAGLNSGTLNDAYNESIVKGSSNVGGIAGTNSGKISLIVNGASVTAKGDYTGGLVGSTTGNISNGRNNGVITGVNYVGGLVGSNGSGVQLTNLTNDSSANITGKQYVGGIAGINSGTIKSDEDNDNLINRGSITGNQYVGGIAGENNGTIANVNNDIVLNATGSNAQYFGGVTGINKGTITNATNSGNINASGATYVGGITGQNDGILSGAGNSNEGKVTGKDYVGGVAGLNTKNAKITTKYDGSVGDKDNIIVIKNEGEVKAEAGGAGGIFGKNEANIQYAEFVNSGIVTGTAGTTGTTGTLSGTGGIFGENTGNIDHSSLKNEVNGNVSGVNNVGGLIGINSGTITGGRDDADTYYKYQIYNNGTITATGTNSANIGGLIGENTSTGSLTAGYNTGNIVASDDGIVGTNVGGIVGNNEGTVKEVFNTIAGNGSVTGNTNVGGLIGTNSGKLSNAYSTSTVVGKTNVGNVVGDNTNGTVTNIYATNTSGNLIGTNNGTINTSYSFSSSDKDKTDINITYLETEADQKDKDKYTSFDENTWKFYDGNANPLLKVFLTKAEFVPTTDKDGNNVKPNFVYNGKQQGVLIRYNEDKNLVEVLDAKNTVIGTIKVADEDAAHSLEDYINTIGQDNQLIDGVQFIDAGTYEMLFSQQINTDGKNGNPNNLGFDFVTSLDSTKPDNNNPPTITNDKAQINITLNDIERIYGNLNINSGNYGFTYGIANGQLTDEMKKELLNKLQLGTVDTTKDDGALVENGTKTNNVGEYTWTGTVTLDDSLLGNYEFTNNSNSITVNNGKSTVDKADLVVDLNKVYHTYGDPNLKDYGIDKVEGLTNGDEAFEDKLDVTMTHDDALTDNNTHTKPAGGDYTWTGSVDGIEGLEDNYNITINPGKSTVDKGHLTITVDDSNTTVGDNPNYGGTVDGWANGDNPNDFDINFGLDDDTILDQPGKHDGVIGVIIDGTFYPSGTEDDIFNNYDVTISTGDLTVLKPIDINDYKNWSHLYKDAPWDRNRDFKERKAEFNFVDGAIPLDEAVEEA